MNEELEGRFRHILIPKEHNRLPDRPIRGTISALPHPYPTEAANMNEYTDIKNRKHKVKQTVRGDGPDQKTKEYHEAAECEIVEALFRIFQLKTD